MMLIFDVMQHRIIDSIAPGTIYSPRGYTMADFTKHVICRIYFYQPFTSNCEPSRTTQTGNGKSSSIAVCALQDAQLRFKVKVH